MVTEMQVVSVLDATFVQFLMPTTRDLFVLDQENDFFSRFADSGTSRLRHLQQLADSGILGDFNRFGLPLPARVDVYFDFVHNVGNRRKSPFPYITLRLEWFLEIKYFEELFPNCYCVERKIAKNDFLSMDQALKTALNQPNVDDTLISAVEHADLTMRRFVWRGFKPRVSTTEAELIVDGKTAKDFVNEALKRLCAEIRAYDSGRTLLENLNSITDSLIWSAKKASGRTGVIDFAPQPEGDDKLPDPIDSKPGRDATAAELLLNAEQCTAQAKCFDLIKASFDGDKEVQDYLDALSNGFYKPDEISELTGISVQKIYEIRRKLKKYTKRLLGVTNFAELKRKLETPENESEPKSTN